MNMPDNFLGFTASYGEKPNLGGYPLLYELSNDIVMGSIGETTCLFIIPKEVVKLPMMLRMVEQLQGDFNKPCVIVSQDLSKYQITRLTEENVAWVNSGSTFFLPFLGLSLRGFAEVARSPKPLSPQAQRVAIHIIDGSWAGKSTSEVAELLDKSLASTSNYFKEIELILPSVLGTQGRKRFIEAGCGMGAAELFATFEPHLTSPVSSRVYLKFKTESISLLGSGCFYAGITALSKMTMLADNPWTTYATDAFNRAYFNEYARQFDTVGKEDAPDILLECWSYDIDAHDDCVDGISLYLSLRDNNEDDPRLEDALENLRDRIFS